MERGVVSVWKPLAAIVAVSALARFGVSLFSTVPWIFPDEWTCAALSSSFARTGHFSYWGSDWSVQASGPLYALLIAPAYKLTGGLDQAYMAVKAINALVMSLAAVPAYHLARRLVSHRSALFAAALVLLVPSMVYTTKVMTESLAYPLFLAFALAVIRVLERPTVGRQAAVLALGCAAFLTRGQMIVLVPAYLTAILVAAALDARAGERPIRSRLGDFRATWFALLGAGLGAGAALAVFARSPLVVLGTYRYILARLDLVEVPRWFLYHVATLDVEVGVIPFAAYLVFVVLVVRNRSAGPVERAFVAFSVPAVLWFTALAAVWGTMERATPHVFQRYVFYVVPFLFVGLLAWIEAGLPRPRRLTLGVAAVACVLPGLLPFGTLLNGTEWGVSSSTPSLVPWAVLASVLGRHLGMICAVVALCGALALLFARGGTHRAPLLRFVVLANLWAVTLFVGGMNVRVSDAAARFTASSGREWIDQAVGRDEHVAAIWAGTEARGPNYAYAVLETQFFNRSVRTVYALRSPFKDKVPSRPVAIRDGRLVLRAGPDAGKPLLADYVVADDSVRLRETPIARDARTHLVLYRVEGFVDAAPVVPPAGE